MTRTLLAALLLACSAAPAPADLKPELNQPYHLRIALRVAPHPQLTKVFKHQLQRGLGDGLQAALGQLAEVEILDLNDAQVVAREPLLQKVAAGKLSDALEGPLGLSPYKTHFVFVDFVNGQYEIEARQHDGFTGLASAIVRRAQTSDRLLVARTAALLVNQDFGLTGTIQNVESNRVEVAIKGGGLGVPLTPWVKKDEVFAIVALGSRASGLVSERVAWALLRVAEEPRDGICRCQLFSRQEWSGQPLPKGPVGFRCLKLGTTEALLRLRFITDDKYATPIAGLQVLASKDGFQGTAAEQHATKADGLVQLTSAYKHMAFIQVLNSTGTAVVPKLPVEVISGRLVVCRVGNTKDDVLKGQLDQQRRRWSRFVNELVQEESSLVKELNALADKSREEAIKKAKVGFDSLKSAIERLRDEGRDLKRAAGNTPIDLSDGEESLNELEKRRDGLARHIKGLEEVEKLAKDPVRQAMTAKALQAWQLEQAAEFDKAIPIYEKLLKDGSDDPQLPKYLERLKHDWQIKSPEHRAARTFIYESWPKSKDPVQLKTQLEEVRKAFEVCRNVGDRLTPQKLLLAMKAHVLKLEKDEQAVKTETDDGVRLAETITEVATKLKELTVQVAEFVRGKKDEAKAP